MPRPAGRTGRWTIALLALALLAPAQRAAFDSAAVIKQIRTADPNDLQRVLGAISADDAKLLTRDLLRNVEGPDAYKFLAAITVLLRGGCPDQLFKYWADLDTRLGAAIVFAHCPVAVVTGNPTPQDILIDALHARSKVHTNLIVGALGQFGTEARRAVPDLIPLLGVPDSSLTAAGALVQIYPESPDVVRALARGKPPGPMISSLRYISDLAVLRRWVDLYPDLRAAIEELRARKDLTPADSNNLVLTSSNVEQLGALRPWWQRLGMSTTTVLVIATVAAAAIVGLALVALIRRMRSSAKRQKQQAELRREVVLARENMHRILQLPQGPVERNGIKLAHRLRQSTTIAGDFYNVIPRGDGTLGIYLVDIEGHGLRASQGAQDIFRALNRPNANWGLRGSPYEQLSAADRILREDLASTGASTTMSFTEIDPASGHIAFANAGMPFPLLFRSGQTAPEVLKASGVWVGAGYSIYVMEPKQAEATAAPGDILILLSDGILEATDAQDRLFGQHGVELAVFSAPDHEPEALADHILAAVAAHSGLTEPEDDQTLVVVQLGQADRSEASSTGTRVFRVDLKPNVVSVDLVNSPEFVSQEEQAVDSILKLLPESEHGRVRVALEEALENAIRHGSGPGDSIPFRFTYDPAASVAEITQPRPWRDWDRELGDARKRYWQRALEQTESTGEAPPDVGGGCRQILFNSDEAGFSSDGTTLTLRFLATPVP